jgi:hypothetical protein
VNTQVTSLPHSIKLEKNAGKGGCMEEETLFSYFRYAYLSQFTLIFSKNVGRDNKKKRPQTCAAAAPQ